MKCGLCREVGHNRATCPKAPPRRPESPLPRLPAEELMRLLIPPAQALDLLVQGSAAEALANATRQIGDMNRGGIGHLACTDILLALAELELRAKKLGSAPVHRIQHTADALEAAKATLAQAEHAHARAKAEALVALGYRHEAEEMGFRIGIVEAGATS